MFTATISQPDEDGNCTIEIQRDGERYSQHAVRCDHADQWTAQELECLAQYADALPLCEYCGEPGDDDDALAETITSPPVSGYPVETMTCHSRCASEAARSMVI